MRGLNKGFSLIELLVAMSIGVMILAVSIATFDALGRGVKQSKVEARVDREARAAMSSMRADLDARVRGRAVFTEGELSFYLLKKPKGSADQAAGDLCFVRYYLAKGRDETGYSRRLYRQFVDAAELLALRKTGGDVRSSARRPELDEAVAYDIYEMKVEGNVLRLSFYTAPQALKKPSDWEEKTDKTLTQYLPMP